MGLNIFKADTWWKAVFALGLTACIGAAIFHIEFIEKKHLFGFGIGLLLIGLSHWMAWKTVSQFVAGGILSTKAIKHNLGSSIMLIIGIGIIGLFGFLIIKELV